MLGHTQTTNEDLGKVTITVFYDDGSTDTIHSDHRNFEAVRNTLRDVPTGQQDDDEIRELINLAASVERRFRALSERVSLRGGNVYFDGDPIDNSIAEHIMRLVDAGDEHGWKALVNFLEKVATNPSDASKQSLYTWLKDRKFTILPNGDFLAYKGCKWEGDKPVSIHAGPGIVNGVAVDGFLDNSVGNVVEIQRSYVDADTFVGCSTGLHAGSYEYAKNFGRGVLLRVTINPRDVVSVPEDCSHQKLRVCRYTVLEAEDAPYEAPTYTNTYWSHDGLSLESAYSAGYDAGRDDALDEGYYDDEYAGDFDEDLTDDEVDDILSQYVSGYRAGWNDGEEERAEEDDEDYEDDEDDEDYEDESDDDYTPYTPAPYTPRKRPVTTTAFPVAVPVTVTDVPDEDETPVQDEDVAEVNVEADEASTEVPAPRVTEVSDEKDRVQAFVATVTPAISRLAHNALAKAQVALDNLDNLNKDR